MDGRVKGVGGSWQNVYLQFFQPPFFIQLVWHKAVEEAQ